MNPINRIGQKVVCIFNIDIIWVCSVFKDFPKRGGIYTVTRFASCTPPDGGEEIPGISLRECPDFVCPCLFMVGVPWPIAMFRPLDERKTDISAFKLLLNPTSVKEKV